MIREGVPFVLIPLAVALILAFLEFWVGVVIFVLVAAFMIFFFRNPNRNIPTETNIIVSAADGKVTRIEDHSDSKFVSVFLSPFDVHINRAPISGKIIDMKLFKGKKISATNNRASNINERNAITIEGERIIVVCTQIVGILARRIVCWNKKGDRLARGERFGLIKFGSRVDLLMPKNVDILVSIGDRVKGGETIIAKLVE